MLVTLREVLSDAQKNGYAVGLFNTVNSEMLQGVLEAAEQRRSPVIIGTAEVLLPYGPLEWIAAPLLEQARRASVPVVVHFDHGLTFNAIIRALRLGFSSVMMDSSTVSLAENIKRTREIVRIAHACGASVEAELGHVGEAAAQSVSDCYTDPDTAMEFVEATKVDALAVSIGTAHGQYKQKPHLDVQRLEKIRQTVQTPLVLHGGSGLTDDEFHRCIRAGISKVNIFTDLTLAANRAVAQTQNHGYLAQLRMIRENIQEETARKMDLFGSSGRA